LVILACERGGWQELKYASEKLLGEADFMLKVLEISNSYSVLIMQHKVFWPMKCFFVRLWKSILAYSSTVRTA